ncbi:hypothetical protein IFM89_027522 [Coptis chinensis]|uniref:Uncharacterized protein n=1 Tax=Coptis chinensis TaxID=261450 RepID=A0A835LNP6_9MAGN|nr:hypothetical protein IFM89_027522 [Coptis chinensis]
MAAKFPSCFVLLTSSAVVETSSSLADRYREHLTEDFIFSSMVLRYGCPGGNPVWHFPEKVYETEETLRKCAESALKSVLGDLSHTYFVGNGSYGSYGDTTNG